MVKQLRLKVVANVGPKPGSLSLIPGQTTCKLSWFCISGLKVKFITNKHMWPHLQGKHGSCVALLLLCILIKSKQCKNVRLASLSEYIYNNNSSPKHILTSWTQCSKRVAMSSWHLGKERATFHLVCRHKEASSAKGQRCLGSWAWRFILRSARLSIRPGPGFFST